MTAKIEQILIYLDSPDIPACPKDAVTNGLGGTQQQVLNPGSQLVEAARVPPPGKNPTSTTERGSHICKAKQLSGVKSRGKMRGETKRDRVLQAGGS